MHTIRNALLVLVVAACGLASANAADIKIGVAQALSGAGAQYGISERNGFELATSEINQAGGINGNKLDLIIENTQGEKAQAINVFRKLIFRDRVAMIFGPTFSNTALSADPIAQGAKVVAFGTSNTANGITSIGNFIFRNSVTEADVLPVTLAVAQRHLGFKKVAIIYGNDDDFTLADYNNFKAALEKMHIPVTTTQTFSKGSVDYRPQLTQIASTHPDAIVLGALFANGAPIMTQAQQLGIHLPFIGGNGMVSSEVFKLAPGSASNNLWVGSPWSISNHTPENDKFVAAYKARYNKDPDQFAAQAYDAVYIASQALKKVRFTGKLAADREAIRDALPDVRWVGATGPFHFVQAVKKQGVPLGYDAKQSDIVVSVSQDGKFVVKH